MFELLELLFKCIVLQLLRRQYDVLAEDIEYFV